MEQQTTAIRRPVALWILIGLYSFFTLGSIAFNIYLRFWSRLSGALEARYADWALVDYVITYYPAILVLIGCLGLVMLRRWAVYVFGMLLALRLREFIMFLMHEIPDVPAYIIWPQYTMSLGPPAIAFFYSLHLARKRMLRKGASWIGRKRSSAKDQTTE